MWRFLTLFSEWLLKGSVQTVLKGAGLGLGSTIATLAVVQAYIDKVVSESQGFKADMLALCALSGADIALSAILGAIVYKLTVSGAKLSLMKLKS